ncbi:hypothetical protein C9980_25825 [Vibrio mediterranei]|uniref:hypothetical protein n=1 Tax=Vibrio mediterranei TaxID=689 RepID=UPI000D181EEF|nr:hypothetical protein [Vibrio mediterranei]PTC01890.1 hypothetical protein C9980_25825 [Vibrio mediterranei]
MSKIKFRDGIDNIVESINLELESVVLARRSIASQWERGNGSVIRVDTNQLATLSINLHDSFYGVGCDGSKKGINDYLSSRFELHRENSQNVRYRCTLSQLRTVIKHFATISHT